MIFFSGGFFVLAAPKGTSIFYGSMQKQKKCPSAQIQRGGQHYS